VAYLVKTGICPVFFLRLAKKKEFFFFFFFLRLAAL
jgi:hypothetical protein